MVVLIHLSILLALCVMATVDYSPAAMQPPIAFLNSEATLLGIWFAVAPVRQLVRYLGLVAGLVVIWQSFFVFMVTAEPSTPGAASCLATLVLLVAPTLAVSLTATLAWPRPAADIGATVPRRVQFGDCWALRRRGSRRDRGDLAQVIVPESREEAITSRDSGVPSDRR